MLFRSHKTSAANQGFVTAGSFDISKWFRPVFLTYQMFPNQSGLVFKQGEPACYVKFNTSSKVVLKQFSINQSLLDISAGCTSLKDIAPNLPLANLYHKFTASNTNKKVLKEIQKTLL